MSNQQENAPELKAAKERILEGLRAGTATGIIGVGIDPDPIQSKLIVFFSHKAEAENYLLSQFGQEFSSFTRLYPGKVRKQPPESIERGPWAFLKRILQILARFPLRPASRIRPNDGDEGRVGCFVSLNGGAIEVLTVEHLFYRRDEHEVFYRKCNQNQPQCFGIAGKSNVFGGLQSGIVNRADCALFSPSNGVVLKPAAPMTGNFIADTAIKNTETKTIKTLVPNRSEGQVLDADAAIKYEVVLGQLGRQEVLLEGQILIKSPDQGFGVEGDSGALVVIAYDDPNGPFKEGDALGLYSVIIDNGDYHYATPLYYCLPAVGAKGIHLP